MAERLLCADKALLAHGGAGGWDERRAGEALSAVRAAVQAALGYMDDPLLAVVKAVKSMEDSGALNAGLGAVTTLDGSIELDAGVASSEGLVGAVAGVAVKNPILAALVVALETPHVLMVGRGAEQLALSFGVERHPGATPERLARLIDRSRRTSLLSRIRAVKQALAPDTVGAVAVAGGVLAAGTSTGGVMGKLRGRVGDTPVYGAGYYADGRIACSATGIGESILLTLPCYRLSLEAERRDVIDALVDVVKLHTKRFGCGNLGLIVADRNGCIYAATNARMPIAYTDGSHLEALMVGRS